MDVYIHSWKFDGERKLLELYRPASYKLETPPLADYDSKYTNTPNAEKYPPRFTYRMFYSMNECRKLIFGDYDWIIRSRTDYALNVKIPFEELDNSKLYIPNCRMVPTRDFGNDQFAFSSKDNMMKYMSTYENIDEYYNGGNQFIGEDLMATYKPSSSFVSNMGRVDPSALTKPEEIEKMKSRLQVEFLKAKESGDPAAIAKADRNIANVVLLNEKLSLDNKSEAAIQSGLITDIQTAQAKGTPQGQADARIAEAKLIQRKRLAQALPTVTVERTTQSNWISIANGALMRRMEESIPGKFIPVVSADGTISLTPKSIGATEFQAALNKAKNEIVSDFTSNGAPKSEFHKNALISIGIGFRNGRPVVGGNVLTTADVEAQKAAAAASAVPAPAPAPTAPVVPAVPTSTASGRSTPTSALPLPYTPEGQPDTSKLIAGKTYRSSTGGTRKWNGTNWEPQ